MIVYWNDRVRTGSTRYTDIERPWFRPGSPLPDFFLWGKEKSDPFFHILNGVSCLGTDSILKFV